MEKSLVEVTFTCPKCGNKSIEVEDKTRDDSAVRCAGCGALFNENWGQLKSRAGKEVLFDVTDAIKKMSR